MYYKRDQVEDVRYWHQWSVLVIPGNNEDLHGWRSLANIPHLLQRSGK